MRNSDFVATDKATFSAPGRLGQELTLARRSRQAATSRREILPSANVPRGTSAQFASVRRHVVLTIADVPRGTSSAACRPIPLPTTAEVAMNPHRTGLDNGRPRHGSHSQAPRLGPRVKRAPRRHRTAREARQLPAGCRSRKSAQPLPAAQAVRRRRTRGAHREHQERTACFNRWWCGRSATDISSSPASAGCARPQAAGLAEVPVHVVAFDDQQVFEAALVENIQRSDLNPIEKAQGFKEYLDKFGIRRTSSARGSASTARRSATCSAC